jgi:hypothetical protein
LISPVDRTTQLVHPLFGMFIMFDISLNVQNYQPRQEACSLCLLAPRSIMFLLQQSTVDLCGVYVTVFPCSLFTLAFCTLVLY